MRSVLVAILVLTLMSAVCMVAPVSAGEPHNRTGFFIGFGAGAGTAGWENGSDRSGGYVGNFRIGYAVAPEVTIGLESSSWMKRESVETIDLTLLYNVSTFGATYYPRNTGVFLKGGIGFASASFESVISIPNIGTAKGEIDDSGFGLIGAVGYEWRLTPKFALGPEVEFVYLNVGGEFGAANYVSGTLMLNWYW